MAPAWSENSSARATAFPGGGAKNKEQLSKVMRRIFRGYSQTAFPAPNHNHNHNHNLNLNLFLSFPPRG
jgi:hypothetical protein